MSIFSRFQRHVGKYPDGASVKTKGPGGMFAPGAGYEFLTGIVKEYISDIEEYLDIDIKEKGLPTGEKLRDLYVPKDKIAEGLSRAKKYVSNPEEAEIMPRNSIIAYVIDESLSSKKQKPFICYPFFPSHLSLPLKPGEHVWLIKEGTYGSDRYYWMCRKPGFKQTEDTNYTYVERIQKIDNELDDQKEKIKILTPLDLREFADFEPAQPNNLPEEINNDKIVFESLAYRKEFTGEPVPSVKQKCGDTLLQGSNNTLLHLTTEKFELSGFLSMDPTGGGNGEPSKKHNFTGTLIPPLTTERQPQSPAIDICVGRKRKELEALKNSILPTGTSGDIEIIKNQRGENYTVIEHYEMNKVAELQTGGSLKSGEGIDVDATNCSARMYLSGDCAIDSVFGTSFDILTGHGGTALATFADNNRVVADATLRLTNRTGQSFIDMDMMGNIVAKSSIAGGQQLLSLSSLGTTRLQARAFPLGKIELAVRNDNGSPEEPYVLYSELRGFLADMCADIAALNALVAPIGLILNSEVAQPIITPILTAAFPGGFPAIDELLASAGASPLFSADSKITITTLPVELTPLGRLGSANNIVESGTIASKKIFGE